MSNHGGTARPPSTSTSARIRAVVIVVGAGVLLAAGCGSTTGDTSAAGPSTSAVGTGGLDATTFTSTSVTGGAHTLVAGTTIEMQYADGQVSVSAGCNRMGGSVSVDGDRMTVSDLASTTMACDAPLMAQDAWVSAFLTAGPTWALDGDTLTLTGADGTTIALTAGAAVADQALVGPTWTAETIVDGATASSVAGAPPTFTFAADGQVTVFDGCNRGGGGYTVAADAVTFAAVRLTMMACPDASAPSQDAVASLLSSSPVSYRIDGDVLSLRTTGGTGLDLRAG